jgi:hypothetical protein
MLAPRIEVDNEILLTIFQRVTGTPTSRPGVGGQGE